MRLFNGVRILDTPCLANVRRIDNGCIPMVCQMNRNGLLVDPSVFLRQSEDLALKMEFLEYQIEELVGRKINPNSGDQVAPLLFRELGLTPPGGGRIRMTKTRTRESTEGDILTTLTGQHPVVDLILEYREYSKLKSTYLDAFPLLISPDGRLRTLLKLYTARTGRMSSEEPNLQNIPVKTEEGMRVRHGFIAPRRRKIISLDLSQIEMVVSAHLSQDPSLMRVFIEGLDIHTTTASGIFRIPPDQVDRMKHRLVAKTTSFLVLYLGSAETLQIQILVAGGPLWSIPDCQGFIDGWFGTYPEVLEYMGSQHRRALRYGMTWTMFGRPREIPQAHSALPWVREEGLRQSSNHPVQGSAGDILKINMAALTPLVEFFNSFPGEECLPCLQVHDELLFECTDPIVDDFMGMAKEVMETTVPLSIPVRSSAMAGEHWGMLK